MQVQVIIFVLIVFQWGKTYYKLHERESFTLYRIVNCEFINNEPSYNFPDKADKELTKSTKKYIA